MCQSQNDQWTLFCNLQVFSKENMFNIFKRLFGSLNTLENPQFIPLYDFLEIPFLSIMVVLFCYAQKMQADPANLIQNNTPKVSKMQLKISKN